MHFIVGLGNPGKEYAHTRHNFGWLVLDALTKNWKSSKKFKAELAELAEPAGNQKIILTKPQTFMNNSGDSVKLLTSYYHLTPNNLKPNNLIIIHDDLDLPLGTIKLSTNSGAAGHHGVLSIIEALGTKNFTRLRLGIGPRPPEIPGDKFVLQKFTREEQAIVKRVIKETVEKILNLFHM